MMHFIDPITQQIFEPDNGLWLSPLGEPSLITRDFTFSKADIQQHIPGLWRYRKAIALPSEADIIGFNEGMTPICETQLFGQHVKLKQEYLFPTGSYKDRGAATMINAARYAGVKHVLEDSSGNAGCAVSAYAAAAGIGCSIYVPANASAAKINQMELYGSTVHKIAGTRQDAADAALTAANASLFASHVYNPWFYEGTKTFAYEIWEQCGNNLPDEIIFPVGNGTLILGAFIGFNELLRSGAIKRLPILSLVQAENCSPLLGNEVFTPTKAEGIAVQKPARKRQILEAVKQTGGNLHSVTEAEIEAARRECAQKGLFIEYTSASAVAILAKKTIPHHVLIPLTGHGLKIIENNFIENQ